MVWLGLFRCSSSLDRVLWSARTHASIVCLQKKHSAHTVKQTNDASARKTGSHGNDVVLFCFSARFLRFTRGKCECGSASARNSLSLDASVRITWMHFYVVASRRSISVFGMAVAHRCVYHSSICLWVYRDLRCNFIHSSTDDRLSWPRAASELDSELFIYYIVQHENKNKQKNDGNEGAGASCKVPSLCLLLFYSALNGYGTYNHIK